MCLISDSYGVMGIFSFLYMPLCEPRLRNQLASEILNLVSLGRYLRNAGKVGIRLASVHCMTQLLLRIQRATRAVHNRAAAYVAAGGGIFENQL
jgi:hypothetical protein